MVSKASRPGCRRYSYKRSNIYIFGAVHIFIIEIMPKNIVTYTYIK